MSIQQFLNKMIANGLSQNTVRSYQADLELFSIWLNKYHSKHMQYMTASELEPLAQEWLNKHRMIWSPATTCRRLSTLRRYGTWMGASFLQDYRPPKPKEPTPHPIQEGIRGVVRMIESSKNPRHRALLALNGLLGLRISECVGVAPKDFDLVNWELTVRGKGDKTRIVPVTEPVWAYLRLAYIHALRDNTTLTRLTERGARASVTRHGKRAKLANHVASHDLRATFLTAAYNNSHDIRAVQELAGHADSKTTQRYTQVSSGAKRLAASVL